MNRANGKTICAVATVLLVFTLVLGVTEGQSSPVVGFTTAPGTPEATKQFNVTLTVEIDSTIFPFVNGSFSVRNSTGSTVWPNIYWEMYFDYYYPKTKMNVTFTGIVVQSEGNYTLWTSVRWKHKTDLNFMTIYVESWIYVAPPTVPVELYSIEWLKPISLDKPFKAGRTIKIKFSVLDSNDNFKRDETVNVTVTDGSGTKVFTAVYSEGENPVRIKDSTECYVVYWKTEKGMSGEYTITVTFANAQVTTPPETVTIRP